MKDFLLGLGQHVRKELQLYADKGLNRFVHGDSPGGDAQFDIDEIAEKAVVDYVRAHTSEPIAIYTEDQSLIEIGENPRSILVIDPIDGTRPTSAGLEMGMISLARAPLVDGKACLDDVDAALLMEIKSGAWLYGDKTLGLVSDGFRQRIPNLSPTRETRFMFWSIEFNGHPMGLMADAYAHLVDTSANSGGVFIFNSATYSISRIITGQLDAYVDIGNRVLKDHPQTEAAFRKAGRGSILHLFPYDIAAAVFLAKLAGVTITDAYGNSLGGTDLMDITPANQQSCIAASTPELHAALLAEITWELGRPRAQHPLSVTGEHA
ncbi:inositol monophosphatase family protein [Pseudomonas sp. RIT-PI-AD]|uniref:inositol monophosphatase family protein n=1 Tax=Pseudomonas sp. RIT-PI-AD TaxID=3035294 RepID=UPI0021DB7446|nr:inositol monophosphatase family protein [Pseudomonas sp. RIT-PI-AD]